MEMPRGRERAWPIAVTRLLRLSQLTADSCVKTALIAKHKWTAQLTSAGGRRQHGAGRQKARDHRTVSTGDQRDSEHARAETDSFFRYFRRLKIVTSRCVGFSKIQL